MTREEAIAYYKKLAIRIKGIIADENEALKDRFSQTLEATNMAIEALQTEQKWIPVTDRMPEDGQSVLFCDIDNDIMVGYHVKKRPATHFTENVSLEDVKNVRAWMPLPKPYKEESEGKECIK